MQALGFPITTANLRLHTGNHLVLWELVKQGLGVGVIIDEVGDGEPRVRRVLPEHPPISIEMWAVAHREVRTSRRVRLVFDAIVKELAP